ncbi:MAG: TonB-dependent receptor [Bacteroidia bacterium]
MRGYCILFILMCFAASCVAQHLPDTVKLKEAVIVEPRAQSFIIGRSSQTIDSNWIKLNRQNSLAEMLDGSSHLFLKTYSPGGLVNTSLRGMAANHTAILWNGFNLQSPLNGQLELSLIPAFFIDNLEIQQGGAGAMWGSGAIGGSILMASESKFNKGLTISLNSGTGSFGKMQQGAKISFSNKRWSTTTRIFRHSSDNDYRYRNSTIAGNPVERQENAAIRQYGLLQQSSMRLGSRQALSFFGWWQFNDRQIPPTLTTAFSTARQQDESLRTGLQWQRKGKAADLSIRTAWLHDWLQYADSSISLSSVTRSHSIVSEAEAKLRLPKFSRLNLGLNNTYTTASSLKIKNAEQKRNTTALFASYSKSNKKSTATGSVSLRQELIENEFAPMIPAVGFEFHVLKRKIVLRGNGSRIYRLPTFNDLYWQESQAHGNPDLKPERGWSSETGFDIKNETKLWQYGLGVTAFAISTRDLIQWYPLGNIWQPVNRNRVFSRGIENEAHLQRKWDSWQFRITASYSGTRSTLAEAANEQNRGNQLIYTPIHQATATARIAWKELEFRYRHHHVGSRFTLQDNSAWLPAFQTGTLLIQYAARFPSSQATFHIRINNLWNADYQVVEFRPVPLINYEAGISLKLNNRS